MENALTDTFTPIPIDGLTHLYGVSKEGVIRNMLSGNNLKQQVHTTGYWRVTLSKHGSDKHLYVHRLLALAFIPNPRNKPEVNHKDGNKLDYSLGNLEWATSKENSLHAVHRLGIKLAIVGKIGATHPRSKKVQQLTQDGELLAEFGSILEAERVTGCNAMSISRTANGKQELGNGFKWRLK